MGHTVPAAGSTPPGASSNVNRLPARYITKPGPAAGTLLAALAMLGDMYAMGPGMAVLLSRDGVAALQPIRPPATPTVGKDLNGSTHPMSVTVSSARAS